jgi:hypothetical protein
MDIMAQSREQRFLMRCDLPSSAQILRTTRGADDDRISATQTVRAQLFEGQVKLRSSRMVDDGSAENGWSGICSFGE